MPLLAKRAVRREAVYEYGARHSGSEMQHADRARQILAQQLNELRELFKASPQVGIEAARERLRRWKSRTVDLLRLNVHSAEGDRLAKMEKMSFRMGDPFGNLAREAEMYDGFLLALDEELRQHPESILAPALPAPNEAAEELISKQSQESAVFILHGHDELNLLRLKDLLRERWQLDSIDDQVQTPDGGYAQARPNVIFELGWFYGRLGRESICLLLKKGAKMHSDLDGVSRIEFESSVNEKVEEIERELSTAQMLRKAASGV